MSRPTPAGFPEGATLAAYLNCFPENLHAVVRELYEGNTPQERGPAICRMWEYELSDGALETARRQADESARLKREARRLAQWAGLEAAGGRPPAPA